MLHIVHPRCIIACEFSTLIKERAKHDWIALVNVILFLNLFNPKQLSQLIYFIWILNLFIFFVGLHSPVKDFHILVLLAHIAILVIKMELPFGHAVRKVKVLVYKVFILNGATFKYLLVLAELPGQHQLIILRSCFLRKPLLPLWLQQLLLLFHILEYFMISHFFEYVFFVFE